MTEKEKPNQIYAPESVSGFSCLGKDCIDSCCKDWDIFFDREHFNLIQEKIADDKEFVIKFERYVKVIDDSENDRHYASLKLEKTGNCTFLKSSSSCSLHEKYGSHVLPTICASYPRVFSRLDKKVEISGALSCPEIARRTLLSKTPFYDNEIEFDALRFNTNYNLVNDLGNDEIDSYFHYFSLVRQSFFKILGNQHHSLLTRRFTMSNLANKLSKVYYQGCLLFDDRKLKTEIDNHLDENYLSSVGREKNIEVDEAISMVVVQSVFRLYLQTFGDTKLAGIINEQFNYYQLNIDTDVRLFGNNFPPEALLQAYQNLERSLISKHGAVIDRFLTRVIENILYREWFINVPNPFIFLHMVNIRISCLKFLIVSHPDIREKLISNKTISESLLSDCFINVVYLFSRAIDHNPEFLKVVYFAIQEQGLVNHDYTASFLKF